MSEDEMEGEGEEARIADFMKRTKERKQKKRMERITEQMKKYIDTLELNSENSTNQTNPEQTENNMGSHIINHKFDKHQQECITHDKNSILTIQAGAGSGKTAVIVARAVNAIIQDVEPKEILMVSFTRKARKEIKERFEKLFPTLTKEDFPDILTFHKFALDNVLDKNNEIEDKGIDTFVRQVKKDLFLNYRNSDIKRWIQEIRYRKEFLNENEHEEEDIEFLDPDIDYSKHGEEKIKEYEEKKKKKIKVLRERLIFKKYKEHLAKNGFDFTSLLFEFNKFLDTQPNLGYKYVFIDESQDTNVIMFSILKKMIPHLKGLTAVGDTWQSIFSYSGLLIKNFSDSFGRLESSTMESVHKYLLKNYRCEESLNICIEALKKQKPYHIIEEDFDYRFFNWQVPNVTKQIVIILKKLLPVFSRNRLTVYILFRRNEELNYFTKIMKKMHITLDDNVELSIIHKVKGGAADIVIICNVIEMNFPLYKELDALKSDDLFERTFEEKLSEEKRLAYVGITRARKCVICFSPDQVNDDQTSFKSWRIKTSQPSDFIKYIGDACVSIQTYNKFAQYCTFCNFESEVMEDEEEQDE